MAAERIAAAEPALQAPRSLWGLAIQRLLHNKAAMAGMAIIVSISVLAAFAPLIATHDPVKQDLNAITLGPGSSHWLGTDYLGRDAFSRLLHGARISLMVGIFTQAIVVGIGIPVGAIAGYFGGRVDNWLMRCVDVVYAFPDLLLIILLRTVLGGGVFMIFLAIGLYSWTTVARLVRGQVMAAKELDYVRAAEALGASRHRVLARHILPNAVGPVVVLVAFAVPRAIFAEASLSYIGIGIPPPTPSWGTMIQDGYTVIFVAPHLVLFPAVAIGLVMLAFTFVGDGLRDAIDPRAGRAV